MPVLGTEHAFGEPIPASFESSLEHLSCGMRQSLRPEASISQKEGIAKLSEWASGIVLHGHGGDSEALIRVSASPLEVAEWVLEVTAHSTLGSDEKLAVVTKWACACSTPPGIYPNKNVALLMAGLTLTDFSKSYRNNCEADPSTMQNALCAVENVLALRGLINERLLPGRLRVAGSIATGIFKSMRDAIGAKHGKNRGSRC